MKLLEKRELFILGAGAASWWVLQGFERNGLRVQGFLDDRADQIMETGGLPVFDPRSDFFDDSLKDSSHVVIGIMNPAFQPENLKSKLATLGWKNIFTFEEFMIKLHSETGMNCGVFDPDVWKSSESELTLVQNLLSDNVSKDLFDRITNSVLKCNNSSLPIAQESQYFPKDLPRHPNTLNFMDFGALNGDTILAAIRNGYRIDSAVCLEPDFSSFSDLVSEVENLENIITLPLGASDFTGSAYFNNTGGAGSRKSEKSGVPVQFIRVDDVFRDYPVNFIKMDIEGSEFKALKGAEKLIARFRPNLAISVYHLTEDLISIPLMLQELYSNKAHFYLRKHGNYLADTILYVYPH